MFMGFDKGCLLLVKGLFFFEIVFESFDFEKEFDLHGSEEIKFIKLFSLEFFTVDFFDLLLLANFLQKFGIFFR
jgi:hypothetical protein